MKIYISDCGTVLKAQIVDSIAYVQVTGTLDEGYTWQRWRADAVMFSAQSAFTSEQTGVLKTLSPDVYGQLLHNMVEPLESAASRRMRALYRRWERREDASRPAAHCRGTNFFLQNDGVAQFKAMKELYQKLSVHVKAAVQGDVGELVEFIVENDGSNLIERVFPKISHLVDGQLALADCGHITRLNDMTDVHRTPRNSSTMCEDCRSNQAVYCEDVEEYCFETHAYRHSDDNWYTYEEERDEEEEEERDHNGRSMSYSACV